jgi:hypothetical protein
MRGMTLLVVGSLVATLAITVFALTRGAGRQRGAPPAGRPPDDRR